MNETEIKTHRAYLIEYKQRIITDLEEIAEYNPHTDDWQARIDTTEFNEADENEVGDELEAAEERQATLALLETEYRLTVLALKKIENGTYGTCEICGKTIEMARLDADHGARTCLDHMADEFDLPIT